MWQLLKLRSKMFSKTIYSGNFEHPERAFPNTFGKIELFHEYPFLLPCLISAGLTLCAIVFGLIFLKEVM